MASRGRAGPAKRRRPRARPPPVPFLLATPRRPEALAAEGADRAARLARLGEIWDELRPLEEAAWGGRLNGRGLLCLQALRVAYAALLAEER